MPSSISSLTSFLILRPPCSQASGVYQVLSWTVSSVIVWALNVSKTSLGPDGFPPLLFKPPIDLFQSMNAPCSGCTEQISSHTESVPLICPKFLSTGSLSSVT